MAHPFTAHPALCGPPRPTTWTFVGSAHRLDPASVPALPERVALMLIDECDRIVVAHFAAGDLPDSGAWVGARGTWVALDEELEIDGEGLLSAVDFQLEVDAWLPLPAATQPLLD